MRFQLSIRFLIRQFEVSKATLHWTVFISLVDHVFVVLLLLEIAIFPSFLAMVQDQVPTTLITTYLL